MDLKWERLELLDAEDNHAKYYVVWDFGGQGYLAAYGRLGANPQWTQRSDATAAQILHSKTRKGYERVGTGTVEIPDAWYAALTGESNPVQKSTQKALFDKTGGSSAPVVSDREHPLGGLVQNCRNLVSEVVANPDSALHTYAVIVGEAERAREDMEAVESYLESLRALLAGSA